MDPISFTVSPLLREAAELKIAELDRAKQAFKHRYTNGEDSGRVALLEKLLSLVDDIKTLDPHLEDEDRLSAILRCLEQAKEDESVSEATLLGFDQQLRQKVAEHSNRLDVSSLHAGLLKEVMDNDKTTEAVAEKSRTDVTEDNFEVFSDEEIEVIQEDVEDRATTVKDVDTNTLKQYLSGLMEVNGNMEALEELRDAMRRFGDQMIERRICVEKEEMMWWILDILNNRLISDEKEKALKNCLLSPMVIKELVSTLNLKSIREWNWKSAETGRIVSVPTICNGRLYISEDDDMVDILFLHGVATRWAINLKGQLERFFHKTRHALNRNSDGTESNKRPSCVETPLGSVSPVERPHPLSFSPSFHKENTASEHPFGCKSDPNSVPSHSGLCINTTDTTSDERHRVYMRDFFMSRLPSMEGCTPKMKRTEISQANLIKTFVTESKLCGAFEENVYNYDIDFCLGALEVPSHSVIFTVLDFFSVPNVFLDFFKRFLTEKLNIGPGRVVTRAAGCPEHHRAMQLFFTEAIFFFLELAVYKRTGVYLYRTDTTCYFVGTEEQGSQVEEEINKFESIMKLSFIGWPRSYTHIGALLMGSQSSLQPLPFTIDETMLGNFAFSTKHSLGECTTILEWIRVWNSTVGTYAAHLFGPLANAMGSTHLTAVKEAYRRVFAMIFPESNLTTHIIQMLHSRLPHLPTSTLPLEALIYLPHAYGGLGVKNPWVTLFLARDIHPDPDAVIAQHTATAPSTSLAATYDFLLAEPVAPIALGARVANEIQRLSGRGDMKTEARTSAEDLWMLRLYADACFERFGGLEVWCSEWVPMEALRGVRGVEWDEGEEEEGSVGSEE